MSGVAFGHKKSALFVVNTPYQLLNVLNIITMENGQYEVDIAMVHPSLEEYCDIISHVVDDDRIFKYSVFYKAFISHSRFLQRVLLVIEILIRGNIEGKVENDHRVYDYIYVPSAALSCNIVYNHFYRLNRSVELRAYDDGVGTYEGNLVYRHSAVSLLIYRLYFRERFFMNRLKKLYCYHPEIVILRNMYSEVELEEITMSPNVRSLYSESVGLKANAYYGKRVVVFDQGDNPLHGGAVSCIVKILLRQFTASQILIKGHPRVGKRENYCGIDVVRDGLSFEALQACVDFKETLLIAHSSTCCITPYLIFGHEPPVIISANVPLSRKVHSAESDIFTIVKALYKHPERFQIPRSIQELENSISDLERYSYAIKEQ